MMVKIMGSNIRLAFYKGKGNWVDKVIKWWTKSQYSHVEVVVGDTWISSSPRDGGVRSMRMESYNVEHWDIIDYPGVTSGDVFDLFRRTKGNDYDFIGILLSVGILKRFRFGVHCKKEWFCSEFIAECLKLENSHKYSPQHLYEYVTSGKKFEGRY